MRPGLDVLEELFEVVDGDPAAGSTPHNRGDVGGAQPELVHARLHARREVVRPFHSGRNRKPLYAGLNEFRLFVTLLGLTKMKVFFFLFWLFFSKYL